MHGKIRLGAESSRIHKTLTAVGTQAIREFPGGKKFLDYIIREAPYHENGKAIWGGLSLRETDGNQRNGPVVLSDVCDMLFLWCRNLDRPFSPEEDYRLRHFMDPFMCHYFELWADILHYFPNVFWYCGCATPIEEALLQLTRITWGDYVSYREELSSLLGDMCLFESGLFEKNQPFLELFLSCQCVDSYHEHRCNAYILPFTRPFELNEWDEHS